MDLYDGYHRDNEMRKIQVIDDICCVVLFFAIREFVLRPTSYPFRRFLGDVRREFLQRLSVVLHDPLASFLRDALKEGNQAVFMLLHVLMSYGPRCVGVTSVSFAWWFSLHFLLKKQLFIRPN
jgi:hypothetical protein